MIAKLAKMRVRLGIMGAYGERSEQLGLGERTPSSRRIAATRRVSRRAPYEETDRPPGITPAGELPPKCLQQRRAIR